MNWKELAVKTSLVGGALDLMSGIWRYQTDITLQDPESYARMDAMHTMTLGVTPPPSLTEAFAQASVTNTPEVTTTQPIIDVLANFAHSPTHLIIAASLLALSGGAVFFGLKAKGDFEQAANNIDTTRRQRPN